MVEETTPMAIRFKLSLMMFLQFMTLAVFWQQLDPYLDTLGGMSSVQKSWILSSMAIGCLASPRMACQSE